MSRNAPDDVDPIVVAECDDGAEILDGIDDADRVLVELDGEQADRVKRRAWEIDREPNAVLDELVRHGLIHYEDALDLRERDL